MNRREKQVREFLENVFNDKSKEDKTECFEVFSDDAIVSSPYVGRSLGRDFCRNLIQEWCHVMPNVVMSDITVKAYGPVVMTTWKMSGRHENLYRIEGDSEASHRKLFRNPDSLGKPVSYAGEMAVYYEGEGIVRYSCKYDILSIYEQLGYFLRQEEYANQSFLANDRKLLVQRLRGHSEKPITEKEVEVLSLYLMGLSAKQIGMYFSISHRTVETHIQKALEAVGAYNKLHCLEKMIENQLLALWQDLGKVLLSILVKTNKRDSK